MGVSQFSEAGIQQLARILAEAATHSELSDLLDRTGFSAHDGGSKWSRIQQALLSRQTRDRSGNNVAAFIMAIMNPVRFIRDGDRFEGLRCAVNEVLAFDGVRLGEDGKLRSTERATTLTEAEQRSSRLLQELRRRTVHADVLRFCGPELLQDNCFHAVLEATKSVAQKLRDLTSLDLDGADLAQRSFGGKEPLLAINSLRTETERGEQRGFANILVGLFGTFRNPHAHEPKITWPIEESDALDLLSMVSYAHRRIDRAVRTPYQA